MIEFIVEGKPQAKERPRKGKYGNFYTPSKTHAYEELVRWSWMSAQAKSKKALKMLEPEKPLRMGIIVYVKGNVKNKLMFPVKKPDLDNTAKTIMDALNGHAYLDDRQIVALNIAKMYGDRDFVKVKLETVEEI